jgi:hypothetical protein
MNNTRRLLFLIEKRVRLATRNLLYDPRPFNEEQFGEVVKSVLVKITDVAEFVVRPLLFSLYDLQAQIGIRLKAAADFIFINLGVYRSQGFHRFLR